MFLTGRTIYREHFLSLYLLSSFLLLLIHDNWVFNLNGYKNGPCCQPYIARPNANKFSHIVFVLFFASWQKISFFVGFYSFVVIFWTFKFGSSAQYTHFHKAIKCNATQIPCCPDKSGSDRLFFIKNRADDRKYFSYYFLLSNKSFPLKFRKSIWTLTSPN